MHTVLPVASRAAQIPGEKRDVSADTTMRCDSFSSEVSFSSQLSQLSGGVSS
jgi:hypothetical protein